MAIDKTTGTAIYLGRNHHDIFPIQAATLCKKYDLGLFDTQRLAD